MRKLFTYAVIVGINTLFFTLITNKTTEGLALKQNDSDILALFQNGDNQDNENTASEKKDENNDNEPKTNKENESEKANKTSNDDKQQVEKYTVKQGDSLVKIAEKYNTEWLRIWYKNTSIDNPDVISVEHEIIIPEEDEDLEERPLPVIESTVTESEPEVESDPEPEPEAVINNTTSNNQSAGSNNSQQRVQPQARGSSNGNTYTAGYCTWYAKNRRPDLPNNLGNANTWVARAQAQGIPTGSSARPGAIAQQGMHVAYVESVNGDGTITVSEMNWEGLYIVSTRTAPESNFMYIY